MPSAHLALRRRSTNLCRSGGADKSGTAQHLIGQVLPRHHSGRARGYRHAAFALLGRSGVRAIVAFLRSHATTPNRAEEVDAQADARGDPRLGKQWYQNICSTCHGTSGNGYESEGAGTAIGLPGFLSKASDGFIRETIKKGRSNTRMLAFQGPDGLANLSDQEIDDVIVYLRSQNDN